MKALVDLGVCWGEVPGTYSLWKPKYKCSWFCLAAFVVAWGVFLWCCSPEHWIPELKRASFLGLPRHWNTYSTVPWPSCSCSV